MTSETSSEGYIDPRIAQFVREGVVPIGRGIQEYPVTVDGAPGPSIYRISVKERGKLSKILQVGNEILVGNEATLSENSPIATTIRLGGDTRGGVGALDQDDKLAYLGLTLASMSQTSWEGRTLLDLGAGDGALSIYAAMKGASVVAVDNNFQARRALQFNAAMNNVNEKIQLVPGDIMNEAWIQRLQKTGIDFNKIDSIVANIGTPYGDVHKKALEALSLFPNADTFIGGGYSRVDLAPEAPRGRLRTILSLGRPKKPGEEEKAVQGLTYALDYLHGQGFKTTETTIGKWRIKPVSFLARKDVARAA